MRNKMWVWWTSRAKSKFVAQSRDPLSTIRNNKFFKQGEQAFRTLKEGLITCPATYLIWPNVPNVCRLRFEIWQQRFKKLAFLIESHTKQAERELYDS